MESADSVDISFYIGTRSVVECSVHYGRSVGHIYNLLISILEIYVSRFTHLSDFFKICYYVENTIT